MPCAFAYHITWGAYGTRLHGDARRTVDREHNEFGTPVLGPDPEREQFERGRLNFPPVIPTVEQRLFIEATVPATCPPAALTRTSILTL